MVQVQKTISKLLVGFSADHTFWVRDNLLKIENYIFGISQTTGLLLDPKLKGLKIIASTK